MANLPFHLLSSQVAFLGPPLEEGPLPTLFYFSLSCQDSLLADPFNQMPAYLSRFPLRIFSITLPFHEPPLSPLTALDAWANEISKGNDIISFFIDQVEETLLFLEKQGSLCEGKLAASGLSRGAFIAAHAAARNPLFTTILGFAPLTKLTSSKEFSSLAANSLAQSLNLEMLVPLLTRRTLRFYIGNLDTRVHTSASFGFIEKLAQAAQSQGVRSPPIELVITPSIGRDGHGTSKEIFESGGKWILQHFGISHEL